MEAICHLKSGKAPGLNGILIEIYKALPLQCLTILVDLWNKSLDSGSIPLQWCKVAIVPVPKSGDQKHVNNYRGITLLPVITKILFTILASRINTWAEESGILPGEQFGF